MCKQRLLEYDSGSRCFYGQGGGFLEDFYQLDIKFEIFTCKGMI